MVATDVQLGDVGLGAVLGGASVDGCEGDATLIVRAVSMRAVT